MLASETLTGTLSGYHPVSLHALFSGAVPLRLAANESLYMPEEASNQVFLIAEGEIRLYKINAEGREFTLGIFGPGEVVGESELLTGCKRACYAMARGAARLLAQDRGEFLAQLRESPAEALEIARLISAKNQVIERKMESLLFKSAHGKVAEQLLALAEQHSKPAPTVVGKGVVGKAAVGKTDAAGKTALSIDYAITHQEIANLIGATRETVSYVLLDFKAADLIETGRRRIGIRDLAGLKEAARA